jgi:hypothetical protein
MTRKYCTSRSVYIACLDTQILRIRQFKIRLIEQSKSNEIWRPLNTRVITKRLINTSNEEITCIKQQTNSFNFANAKFAFLQKII